MGILTRQQIVKYLQNGKLIKNARKVDSDFDVEAASYDLSVGIAVKKNEGNRIFQKRKKHMSTIPRKNTKR